MSEKDDVAKTVWVCAFIGCGRPEGQPHIEDCPYYVERHGGRIE